MAGDILVHNHCYRADEMAMMLDMAREFGFRIASFHHAVEAYKIGDLLRGAGTCAAMWADWWGFKMESYDAVNENIPLVHNAGACAIVHSRRRQRHPAPQPGSGQGARRRPADGDQHHRRGRLALAGDQPGHRARHRRPRPASLRAGKRADVVLWNGNPFSVYTRPQQVWIDGALMYDMNDPRRRPVSDFELGQPGEGDVK